MFVRLTLAASTAALLCPSAAASPAPQSSSSVRGIAPVPVQGPVRHAGTYHVASGTMHYSQEALEFLFPEHGDGDTDGVGGPVAMALGSGTAEIIYENTALSGVILPLEGPDAPLGGPFTAIDAGGVPTPANIYAPAGAVTRDDNFVTEFQFGYCDFDPVAGPTSGWTLSFYEQLGPCQDRSGLTPLAVVPLSALPTGCWTIDVDLTGGSEFCLRGDGGDGFDDDPNLDLFGYEIEYTGMNDGTTNVGPLVACDPEATDAGYDNPAVPVPDPMNPGQFLPTDQGPPPTAGTHTYYNGLTGCAGTGSGFQTLDQVLLRDSMDQNNNACINFLGYLNGPEVCGNGSAPGTTTIEHRPFASLYLRLIASGECSAPLISTPTACAATNNTSGVPGVCEVYGDPVALNNDVIIRVSNLPTVPQGVFGIFIHSTTDISAAPIAVGQGVLCLGNPGRFSTQIVQADATGSAEIASALGQLSLDQLPLASSLYAATAGDTSFFQFWHRDFVTPSSEAYNFTSSCAITWQ